MSERWLFWLAHGPKVFGALVLALALLGAWLAPGAARALREARRRRRVDALGAPREEVPAGEGIAVVLRGELGAALCTDVFAPLPDGTVSPPLTRAEGPIVLKTRSGAVWLPADVEVLVGATEDERREASDDGPPRIARRSIEAGSVVRAEGVIEPAPPGTVVQGYRGAAPSWRLVAGVKGRVGVAAERGIADVGHVRAQRAAGFVVAGLGCAAALTLAAQATLASARSRRGEVTVGLTRAWCDGGGATHATLASASPAQRAAALDEVALGLRCARARTPSTVTALDAALRARGAACVERAAVAAAMGDLARAADLGVSCGGAEPAARAGWIRAGLGDFTGASAALRAGGAAITSVGDLRLVTAVHALARAWSAAAETARRAAESAGGRRGERDEEVETRELWCVADAMAARGGDPGALARLDRRVEEGTRACRALRAEVAMARGEPFVAWQRGGGGVILDPPYHGSITLTDLQREASLWTCAEGRGGCASGPHRDTLGLAFDGALALRPYQAAQLARYRAMPALDAAQATDAARLAADEARVAAAAGAYPEAQELVRWANDHADEAPRYERIAMLHTQAWITAMAGDRPALDAALGELEGEGERAPDAMVPLAVRRWSERERAGLAGVALHAVDDRDAREAVTAGRGDMLMSWLRRQQGVVPISGRRALLAALNFRVVDRADARDWLRTEDVWLDAQSLRGSWRAASLRLAVATALGDVATARGIREVVRRHREASARAEVAQTLRVLDAY